MSTFKETKKNFNEKIFISNCYKNVSIPNGYKIEDANAEWEFVFIFEGELKLLDYDYALSKGDMIIFPPNVNRNCAYDKNACSYWIQFHGDKIDRFFDYLKIPTQTILSLKDDGAIVFLEHIIKEFSLQHSHYKELAVLYLKSFFHLLSREFSVKISSTQSVIKNVILAMYSNPHISNEECAKLCLMSKDHFIRIFKANMGVTPMQFKKSIIIDRAKNLLIKTDLSITAIAESSGFNDYPLYFNRFFKTATGYYPSQFRATFAKHDLARRNHKNQKD